jgi:putative N-acetylmannosamine-6-phosphate epimerase/predicted NBD/HSP70 family sugar kinase
MLETFRPLFEQLRGKLVVSCQAFPGDALEDTDTIRRIALAVIGGGAAGLRLNSPEHIAAIRQRTTLPIIGIQKYYGPSGLRITPDFASAAALAAAGASIIALDCTDRVWPDGEPWQELIGRIHRDLRLPVLADIATLNEALTAAAAGADCVGPTLNGYTENTSNNRSFSWTLLHQLVRQAGVPIMAEGHIATPDEARRAIDGGAWCVIVGSAITRPGIITGNFARALDRAALAAPAIGVDIGGTTIKSGLVHRDGQVCFLAQVPTEAEKGREAIAAGLVKVVENVLAVCREKKIEPTGVGIATAGAVDQSDGSIFAATDNLPGWVDFQLRAFAEKQFSLPVFVVNDAQGAALSELYFGMGRGLSDFMAITVGTGVGGGVVSRGKLLSGDHGFAGSIGHEVIRKGGRPCNCGRHGCLEAYVSTAALLREFRENGGAGPEKTMDAAALACHINTLACAGNPVAERAYAVLGDYLAEAIANLFNLIDPQMIVLSGGLIEGYTPFVPNLEKRVTELLHFGAKRQPRIRAAHAGRFAGVQGAAALVFEAGFLSCSSAEQ